MPPADLPSPHSPEHRTPDFREPGSKPRWRIGVGAVVVVVLALVAFGVVASAVASADESVVPLAPPTSSVGVATASASAGGGPGGGAGAGAAGAVSGSGVFVHVLGRVSHPGLYEVEAGSRAVDVVAAAGGFAADADQAALNLARPVSDGEQIVVPKIGETPVSAPQLETPGAGSPGASTATAAPVDLNSADAAALQTIRGVGPATAQAILDWRDEHGRFESVEDLLDVSGIGPKKLEALRASVTVR